MFMCVSVSFIKFLGLGWDWVHLVRRPLTGLLYQLRMIDEDECGAVSGMRISRGNRSTRRKPAPVLLSTTNPTWHDLVTNPAAAVGKRRLTPEIWHRRVCRIQESEGSQQLFVSCPRYLTSFFVFEVITAVTMKVQLALLPAYVLLVAWLIFSP
jgi:hypothetical protein